MSAMEPLSELIGIDTSSLTKEENFLLEIELFARLCEELIEIFREQQKDYFSLMKFTSEKENNMLEEGFAQFIINDILSSKEYNLMGIAYYTNSYDEVVQEIMMGRNKMPSGIFLRRLINLHRSVRKELYNKMIKKILLQYLTDKNDKI